jgi:hypothetical protein
VLNNIYASPNKIYDAALVGVPVIINSEIRAADFVARNGLGVLIPSFSGLSPRNVIAELLDRRCEFQNLSASSSPYKWSAVEKVLIDVHST